MENSREETQCVSTPDAREFIAALVHLLRTIFAPSRHLPESAALQYGVVYVSIFAGILAGRFLVPFEDDGAGLASIAYRRAKQDADIPALILGVVTGQDASYTLILRDPPPPITTQTLRYCAMAYLLDPLGSRESFEAMLRLFEDLVPATGAPFLESGSPTSWSDT